MIARIFALLFGALGAGSLSQFPEFAQQYSQRLGGRVDELRSFVQRFDADAARAGLDRTRALAEFDRTGNTFLRDRGADAAVMVRSFERYETAKANLESAAPVERLFVFVRDMERDIAAATAGDYRPAVPVTIEGAVHAGAGFLVGLALAWMIGRPFRRRRPAADVT